MIENDPKNIIIEDFKLSHSDQFFKKVTSLENDIVDLFKVIHPDYATSSFLEYEDIIEKAGKLFDIKRRIKELQSIKKKFLEQIVYFCPNYREREDISKDVINITKRFDELICFLNDQNSRIMSKLNALIENINSCPHGTNEKRTKNAIDFQNYVNELFSWLFIDEIRLLKKEEVNEFRLKRDGNFEIEEAANMFGRRGLSLGKIDYILIECKNYEKLHWMVVMQLFAYTMFNRRTALTDNPLCILVARDKPSLNSFLYRMRDRLLEIRDNNYLLILFLSCQDLQQMVKIRCNNGDPFKLILDQIKFIRRDSRFKES